MTTERQQRAETVIRDALDELGQYQPDEIAVKLRAEGMLWCGPKHRAASCPIHHYLTARLLAHSLEGITLSVGPDEAVAVVPMYSGRRGRNSLIVQPLPKPVSQFVYKYDRGDYKHLEVS